MFPTLLDLISSVNLINMLFTTFFPGYEWTCSKKKKKKALTGTPRALLSTSPTGTASESAINFLQLRGWWLQPLDTILMDSWVSPLISQFGDRTITKDSNYPVQSVIVKMEVERRKRKEEMAQV